MNTNTIAAIATPIGRGGIGIVRISGSSALNTAKRLFRHRGEAAESILSHRIYYGHILDPSCDRMIDEVLLVYMRAPRSYTREDVVEIHGHGGPVAMQQILELVLSCGVDLAPPGEFTKRAFLNGRIDLTQAEAVADIIHAETKSALAAAVVHIQGRMKDEILAIRQQIVAVMADIEAAIDFSDEIDEGFAGAGIQKQIQEKVISPLQSLVAQYHAGHLFREGIRLVIAGKPNVGKSSLMNRFLKKDRVIVTPHPGTTRDAIEEAIEIGGVAVVLIDTAGLRATQDPVEHEGMARTRQLLATADLVLFIVDGAGGINAEDFQIWKTVEGQPSLVVINKVDLLGSPPGLTIPDDWADIPHVFISARFDIGIDALKTLIFNMVMGTHPVDPNQMIVPNVRHHQLLDRCLAAVLQSHKILSVQNALELAVIDLREAKDALDQILGIAAKDVILDAIFSRFCIGK